MTATACIIVTIFDMEYGIWYIYISIKIMSEFRDLIEVDELIEYIVSEDFRFSNTGTES